MRSETIPILRHTYSLLCGSRHGQNGGRHACININAAYKPMLICLAILVTLARPQPPCPTLTVRAIVSCQFTFTPADNSCAFTQCLNDTNAHAEPVADWTHCYASCCPGLVVPAGSTSGDLEGCLEEFGDTPKSFYIIMGLTVGAVLLICLCIPCCSDKKCPLHRLRTLCLKSLKQRFCHQQIRVHRFVQRSQKPSQRNKPQSLASQRKLLPKRDRILLTNPRMDHEHSIKQCVVCTNFDSDLMLPCKHCCHKGCVKQGEGGVVCPKCKEESVRLRVYCAGCSIRYEMMERVDLDKEYICSICNN